MSYLVMSHVSADKQVYVHSAQAQASLLDRRRRRLEAQNVVAAGLCPAGLTACRIQDSTEGFEVSHPISPNGPRLSVVHRYSVRVGVLRWMHPRKR